mmetsp:Transcript_842/g.885  ORF Transcript_842/g.885 Transcript_842/m.885 type:complete len:184 (-) Transcript_842:48-599(-)
MKQSEKYHSLKVALVGDIGVGKSAIVRRIVQGQFIEEEQSHYQSDFRCPVIKVADEFFKIHMWDVHIQTRFATLFRSYYRACHAILLAYDITNLESFENLDTWLNHAKQHITAEVVIILVGTKLDRSHREVSRERAEMYAHRNGLAYVETSSKEATNIREMFHLFVLLFIARREENSTTKAAK